MQINQSSLLDSVIMSPHCLFREVNNFGESLGISPSFQSQLTGKKNKLQQQTMVEIKQSDGTVVKKRKDAIGLKRLIRQQKIENIKRKFIAKLKLNNINSKPVQFQPYYQTQTNSIFDKKGIQIPDWLQKFISGLIVFTILICVFVETTYIAFPQIVKNNVIFWFQIFSLIVFVLELILSMIVVKMVDGKKVQNIGIIIGNYYQDGMLIDIAYLIILIVDFFADAGWFRLIILFKLPQCFVRIQKIENSLVNTFYKQQYWGLTKVFLLNFSFSHILCILVILMSTLDEDNNWMIQKKIQFASWSEQYVWAFYWGTTIMLTVGFGDIAPANYKEAICIVFIETFSCLCLAYNINCVGSLISNIKSQDVEKNRNIKTFKILSNRNNLTQNLEMKIHNYIEESTNIKKKFNFQEESNFISTLPRQLKGEFLKESNKRIFESLVFFKNLTQKTLLNFAEVIQMKICHPGEIIKKRGQISGVMILKEGKIGLSTKLNGSDFNNTTVQSIEIKQSEEPFLLSLDFLSNDRAIYEVKSQQYSILYHLDREKTLQVMKTGQLDYEHFCFLRDKSRNLETDFEVFKCQDCTSNHSRFDCPKVHYCPLKKHVVDKFLYQLKTTKCQRARFNRSKKQYNAFVQLSRNQHLFDLKNVNSISMSTMPTKYLTYKTKKQPPLGNQQSQTIVVENSRTFTHLHTDNGILGSNTFTVNDSIKEFISTEKKIQCQWMAGYLKDEIQKIISNGSQVWLVECDEIKDFKFYFVPYNAGTLQYLHRKVTTKSAFK